VSFPFSGFLSKSPSICPYFKDSDLKYWLDPIAFQPFISGVPDLNSINSRIQAKSESFKFRELLTSSLKEQYARLAPGSEFLNLIESINDSRTFVICCAHQPVVLGGPLYWWYKILHAISLCKHFNRLLPEYNFLPVYYLGNEDHDFEEIRGISIFNKNFSWDRNAEGAVGRMSADNIDKLLDEILTLFNNEPEAKSRLLIWKEMAGQSVDYTDFFLRFVHDIFGPLGLICLNPDNKAFKSEFRDIMLSEIEGQTSNKIVNQTNIKLNQFGLVPQAHSREINLFYHSKASRSRIVSINHQKFHTADGIKEWSLESLKEEIIQCPENFSPNVILRPLFQELILPSVLFVGGGAEVNYWLQLKDLFDHFGLPYPVLVRRNSFVIFSAQILEKIKRLGLTPEFFLDHTDELIKKFMESKSDISVHVSRISEQLFQILDELCELSRKELKSTFSGTLSEVNKIKASIDKLSDKINKDNKHEHQIEIALINKIKEQLFPNNNLQERHVAGLTYYLKFGQDFLIKTSEVGENNISGFYLLYESS